jgi:putative sigma-54 modulation protein
VELKIAARHGTLREDLKAHVEERVPRLTKIYGKLTSVEVLFDHERSMTKVEIIITAEHKHRFVVQEQDPDPKAAADLAFKRAEEALRRHKDKVCDWLHGQL